MSSAVVTRNRNENTPTFGGSLPLWKRLPVVDHDGRPLRDFMMILPRLRGKSKRYVQQAVSRIECVLNAFSDMVVYADYNFDLHVLLVKIKPGFGPCLDIPVAINEAVPEALLVAQPHLG